MNPTDRPIETTPSCCPSGNCGGIPRRDFIKTLTLGAAAAAVPAMPVMAGPFEASAQDKLVPADKKLDPQWVKSLFDRGAREVYRGKDLEKIGMPIGGLCAGQLYLGGDGKLWHWDIFNKAMGTGDHNYAHPPLPSSPLEQGFAVDISRPGAAREASAGLGPYGLLPTSPFAASIRSLTSSIAIRNRPSRVSLEAFSPHIPLDTEASSLPATVMRYTVKNIEQRQGRSRSWPAGWKTPSGCTRRPATAAERRNRVLRQAGAVGHP